MIAVKIGSISWRTADSLAAGEVEFVGDWIYAADGITSLMVWDNALNNVREMTQPEKDALPGQLKTEAAQAEKAAATDSVDAAMMQHGMQYDRLCVAAAQVALDATNNERQTLTAMNTAVQAAASLADLKTRFSAINFPPQVTMAQLQNAIKQKIAATPE